LLLLEQGEQHRHGGRETQLTELQIVEEDSLAWFLGEKFLFNLFIIIFGHFSCSH
jgi:hypothetical protein